MKYYSQFLIYSFISGCQPRRPDTEIVRLTIACLIRAAAASLYRHSHARRDRMSLSGRLDFPDCGPFRDRHRETMPEPHGFAVHRVYGKPCPFCRVYLVGSSKGARWSGRLQVRLWQFPAIAGSQAAVHP